MVFFSPPPLARLLAPSSVVWKVNTPQKKIYLTFDDGPHAGVTDVLLKILSEYKATATFFCLGRQVESNNDLFEKIILHGHSVGNHTYSHINAWKSRPETFREDISKAAGFISSPLFRPPYGNLPLMRQRAPLVDYLTVMWSLMSYDFDRTVSPQKIIQIFQQRTTPGSIWVFHDTPKAAATCLKTVPRLLETFINDGYAFEGLFEGLNIVRGK